MKFRRPTSIEAGQTAAFIEADGVTASVHFYDPDENQLLLVVHLPRLGLEVLRDRIDAALSGAPPLVAPG